MAGDRAEKNARLIIEYIKERLEEIIDKEKSQIDIIDNNSNCENEGE